MRLKTISSYDKNNSAIQKIPNQFQNQKASSIDQKEEKKGES